MPVLRVSRLKPAQVALAEAMVRWLAHAEGSGKVNWYASLYDSGLQHRRRVSQATEAVKKGVDVLLESLGQRRSEARLACQAIVQLRRVADALQELAEIDEVGFDALSGAVAALREREAVGQALAKAREAASQATRHFEALGSGEVAEVMRLQEAAVQSMRAPSFEGLAMAWASVKDELEI